MMGRLCEIALLSLVIISLLNTESAWAKRGGGFSGKKTSSWGSNKGGTQSKPSSSQPGNYPRQPQSPNRNTNPYPGGGSYPGAGNTNPGGYPRQNQPAGSNPNQYPGRANPGGYPNQNPAGGYPAGGGYPNQNPGRGNYPNQNPPAGNYPNQYPGRGGGYPNQNPAAGGYPNQYPAGGGYPGGYPNQRGGLNPGGGYPNQYPAGGGYPVRGGNTGQGWGGGYPAGGYPAGGYPGGGYPAGGYPGVGGYTNWNPNNRILSPRFGGGGYGYGGHGMGGSPFSRSVQGMGYQPKSTNFAKKAMLAAGVGAVAGMAVGYGLGRFPRPHFSFRNPEEEYYYNNYMYRRYGTQSTDQKDYGRDYVYKPPPRAKSYDVFMDECMNRTDLLKDQGGSTTPGSGTTEDDDTVSIEEIGYPALVEQLKARRCVEHYMVYSESFLQERKAEHQVLSNGAMQLFSSVLMLLSSMLLLQ